jgi:hypothetical protein
MIMIDLMSVLFGMAIAPYDAANIMPEACCQKYHAKGMSQIRSGYRRWVAGCKVESVVI